MSLALATRRVCLNGPKLSLILPWTGTKFRKIKEYWGGKVILKGILDKEDAKMALQVGADATDCLKSWR